MKIAINFTLTQRILIVYQNIATADDVVRFNRPESYAKTVSHQSANKSTRNFNQRCKNRPDACFLLSSIGASGNL